MKHGVSDVARCITKGIIMTLSLIIRFRKLSNPVFIVKAEKIGTCLSDKSIFSFKWPAYTYSPDVILAKVAALRALWTTAQSGDRAAIAAFNAARKELEGMLKANGMFLMLQLNGNIEMAEKSGYDLRHQGTKTKVVTAPSAPTNVSVKRGTLSGTIIISATKVPKVTHYQAQANCGDQNVEANWGNSVDAANCGSITISGLTRLKDYTVRLRAFSNGGWGPWAYAGTIAVI
jgi:hypothetical protein